VPSRPTITSRRHPLVQQCRRVAGGTGDAGVVLLDGEHLVEDALDAHVPVRVMLTTSPHSALARAAESAGAEVHPVTESVLDAASPVRAPAGVVALAQWIPTSLENVFHASPALIVGLVDVQDPGNVGAAIRSADALGATGVVCGDATADPGGWRALRGAMGSTFRVPIARGGVDAMLELAQTHHVRVAATSAQDGTSLFETSFVLPTLVLLGHEGGGLPTTLSKRADLRIRIPMRTGVNSLNVGVAAALVLYEAARQRGSLDFARDEPTI